MKMLFVITALTAALLGAMALAQVGGTGNSPIGATSPLALGTGSPVDQTAFPLARPRWRRQVSVRRHLPQRAPWAVPVWEGRRRKRHGAVVRRRRDGSRVGRLRDQRAAPARRCRLVDASTGGANIPLGSTELVSAGLSPLPPVSTIFVSPIVPSRPQLRDDGHFAIDGYATMPGHRHIPRLRHGTRQSRSRQRDTGSPSIC